MNAHLAESLATIGQEAGHTQDMSLQILLDKVDRELLTSHHLVVQE